MADAQKYLTIDGKFGMVRGEIDTPVIAFETWSRLNDRADNAVLIFTGLSPSAHATSSPNDPSTGWWEDMVGPGKPIDSRRVQPTTPRTPRRRRFRNQDPGQPG